MGKKCLILDKGRMDDNISVSSPFTQCTDMHTAIALALIRLGSISDRSRPGTGPAPKENVKTNLYQCRKQ